MADVEVEDRAQSHEFIGSHDALTPQDIPQPLTVDCGAATKLGNTHTISLPSRFHSRRYLSSMIQQSCLAVPNNASRRLSLVNPPEVSQRKSGMMPSDHKNRCECFATSRASPRLRDFPTFRGLANLYEVAIGSRLLHEFFVGAALGNGATVNHEDLVGVADG